MYVRMYVWMYVCMCVSVALCLISVAFTVFSCICDYKPVGYLIVRSAFNAGARQCRPSPVSVVWIHLKSRGGIGLLGCLLCACVCVCVSVFVLRKGNRTFVRKKGATSEL